MKVAIFKYAMAGAFACACAVTGAPAWAQLATTSTQTIQLPYTLTGVNNYPSVNGTARYFDSTLGTLTGVTLSFSNSFSDQAYFYNPTSALVSGSYTIQSSDYLYSNDSAISSLFRSSIDTNYSYNSAINPSTYDYYTLADKSGEYFYDSDKAIPASASFLDATSLSAFSKAGGGSFNVNSGPSATVNFNYSGTTAPTVSSYYETGTAALNIAYHYVPTTAAVPEPAAWLMMILGIGAIGFAMRRQKVATLVSYPA